MRDIVVVGGGPAGLWFVQKMAASGYDSVLYDERDQIGSRKICTGIIGAEAFEDLGLPRASILNGIQHLKFLSPQGRTLDYRHPRLLAHVVNRAAFDHSLAQMAMQAGAEIQVGRRATAIRVKPDRVVVETESTRSGLDARQVEARLLVIATGVNARLNSAVGLGSPTSFLNAVQAHIRVSDLECTHCFAGRNVAPGAFAWLVPLTQGWARVGLMTDGKSSRFFERLLARIAPFREEGEARVAADFKPIVQGYRGHSFAHRVLAVGEAAGQVKATTGGGIYYGILGAKYAVETACEALRQNRLEAAHLQRYEHSWKARMGGEIEVGGLYRRAFSRLSDRQIEALFKLAGWNGMIPLVKRTARFDWHLELLTSLVQYGPIRSILGMHRAEPVQQPLGKARARS